jgi:heme/copper-type cytochrome/quinol oxidase subunit 1
MKQHQFRKRPEGLKPGSGVTGSSCSHDLFFKRESHSIYCILYYCSYGAVFALFGSIHSWCPTITGKPLSEGMARREVALMFIGFNVAFLPMHRTPQHGASSGRYRLPVPDTCHWKLNDTVQVERNTAQPCAFFIGESRARNSH